MTIALCLTLAALLAYAVLGWQHERRAHADSLRRWQACADREAEAASIIVQLTAALRARNLGRAMARLPRPSRERIFVN